MHRSITTLLGIALVASPAGASDDDRSEVQSLRREVAELRAELATVKRGQEEDWLTEARAAQVRSLIGDVLADADSRASLLQSGMTAGWDKKFFLGSADGDFLLNIGGQIQFRWVYNMRDGSGGDDDQWGFESRRTKLKFDGHVVDPSWEYKVVIAMDREGDGNVILEDAWIAKDLGQGWSVRAGRFKGPFLREELVSSTRQLLVDRSAVNERFNQDRSEGIQLTYEADQLRVHALYSDGVRTLGTRFKDQVNEFSIIGRAELLLAGGWSQFKDLTSWVDDDFGVMLGAAAYYDKAAYGTPAGPEEETFGWSVDLSVETGGANLFAYVTGRDRDVAGTDELAFVVQGGLFVVPDAWEVFARYEWGDTDLAGDEDLSVVTAGVNRYWAKHGLKWTTDVLYGLDEITGSWDGSGIGVEEDGASQDGQIVVRTQLQLLF